jgi:hypothetical protein
VAIVLATLPPQHSKAASLTTPLLDRLFTEGSLTLSARVEW